MFHTRPTPFRVHKQPNLNPSKRMNDSKLLHVPPDHCAPAPWANRTDLNLTPEFLADIKTRGVRQSLEVRPLEGKKDRYEIIAGVRRWSAAVKGKLETVPVMVMRMTDQEGREGRLIENLHREGLTALDEAEQYQEALKTGDYGTGSQAVEALAAKIGKSRALVYARLRLLKLAPVVSKAVAKGDLDQTVAELVATIPGSLEQERALKEILKGDSEWNPQTGRHERSAMSFRRAKEYIAEEYRRPLGKAPFKLDQRYEGVIEGRTGKGCQLVDCGTCVDCPKRSGNFPDFAKGTDPNVCTDMGCYDAKALAEWDRRSVEAIKNGQRVIQPQEWEKLQHSDSVVVATAKCYDDPKCRTFGALAKLGDLKTAVARDADGEIFEVVSRAEAKKAGGVKERSYNSGGSGRSAADKEREAKKKLRVDVAKAAVPTMLEAFRGLPYGDLWKSLAVAAYRQTSIDEHAFVAKRRGLAKVLNEVRPSMDKWLKGEHSTTEFRDMATELLLCSNHGIGTWNQNWAKEFKTVCDLAKIDLVKLEKQLAAEKKKPVKASTGKVASKAKK